MVKISNLARIFENHTSVAQFPYGIFLDNEILYIVCKD